MSSSKSKFLLGGILVGIMTLALAMPLTQDSDDSSDWSYGCPMMRGGMGMMGSGGMMGPSTMGGGMSGMGMMSSGMMGRSMMHGSHGSSGKGPWADLNYGRYGVLLEPLSKGKAEEIAKFYLNRLDNPRLRLGKITEKDKLFEVEIVTKDKSLVDEILIEKSTGWLYPAKD